MNYSVIESAKERYVEYDRDYQKLVKEINLHLFSLARTNFNEGKKNEVWRELINRAGNISDKAEEELNKLDNVRFSESDFVLQEEKKIFGGAISLFIKSFARGKIYALATNKKRNDSYCSFATKNS